MILRAALLSIALAACAVPAQAQPQPQPQPQPASSDTVTLNFVNADIEGVVKAVGEITGKNFVLDPRVKGTVNIVSAQADVAGAGLPGVPVGAARCRASPRSRTRGMVKIVPEADAKLHASATQGRRARAGDRSRRRCSRCSTNRRRSSCRCCAR